MRFSKIVFIFISTFLLSSLLSGCGGSSTEEKPTTKVPDREQPSQAQRYQPSPASTWQWQLSGTVNTRYDASVYDIDLLDSSKALIQQLHRNHKKVICYFSAGSYENWRSDAAQFKISDLGKALDGWQGERWLDIRSSTVRQIMTQRLALAQKKGCDAVEPDNMDGYSNQSGFNLSAQDQLNYNRFIAQQAHAKNLAVGLKNDLDQVSQLVDVFDFAVNEQCFEYAECNRLTPFIQQGKAVFNAEYKSRYASNAAARQSLCKQAKRLRFSTLILPLDLDDSFRYSCQ